MAHAQRLENELLDEVRIRHTGNFFDDRTQQDVAGIAILELLARLELKGLVLEQGDQLVERHILAPQGQPFRHVGITLDPGSVSQQVFDGDVPPAGRVIRQEASDFIMDAQLILLLEHQDAYRGELLGDRTEPEDHLRFHLDTQFQVRHPISLAEQDLSSPNDDHRRPGLVGRV